MKLFDLGPTPSVSDRYREFKTRVSLDFNGGIFLTIEEVWVDHEGKETAGHYPTSFGVSWSWQFGYTCIYYDGYWKRLSLGPLFVAWFSIFGEETGEGKQ